VHIERYGYGGPPVVLLHGFGTTSFLWRHIAPELAVAGHTAFAFDLFGYGVSDRPFDADYGIRAQSLYVRSVIAALGIARPTLVGCDLGAVIALRVAFDQPESVGGLVLVSPSSMKDLPGPHIRLMQRATARYVFRLVRGIFGAEPLIRTLLHTSVVEPLSLSPRLVGRFVAPYVGRDGVNHLLSLARALEDEDLSDVSLAAIMNPVLIVRGSDDRWCGADYVQSLVESLPNARAETIADAGRLIAEEAPAALVDAVIAQIGLGSSTSNESAGPRRA
jgi:pimeloyl-ACP methyl ester carboxylesterase